MAVSTSGPMGRKRIAVSTEIARKGVEDRNFVESCSDSFGATLPSSNSCSKEENLRMGSCIESLPLSILVRIVCNLCHDELKPVASVSPKFKEAVRMATQIHFDFSTPVRGQALPKAWANSALENAPIKAQRRHKSQLSAKHMRELQSFTLQTKFMIEHL